MKSELGFQVTTFFYHTQSLFLCCMSLHILWCCERAPMGAWCTLYMCLNLHLFPSYARNNKHCYGGDDTNGCWQADGHINGHNTGMREQFPASTYREAEWSVLHNSTGEALLTLECAAVFLLNLSWCWWGLDGSLILSTTISSCKYQYHNCDCVFWVQ